MQLSDKIEIKAVQKFYDIPFTSKVMYRKAKEHWYDISLWKEIKSYWIPYQYTKYDESVTLDDVISTSYDVDSSDKFSELCRRLLTYKDIVDLEIEEYNKTIDYINNHKQ